ncbi:MAG: 50S ribosomal protein L11 methyltransferase [Lysobacterales bacterium]
MTWQELSVTVSSDRAEEVQALMESAGAQAVTLVPVDLADPVLEPAPLETPLWDSLVARGLFDAAMDGQRLIAIISEGLNPTEAASVHLAALADQPWERTWLDHFEPVSFGKREPGLWICPWHYQPAPTGDVLFMDPGLAFGTGSHATTALCLDVLADSDLKGRSLLDLGCGSGILALAAALRGAGEVIAVDNDPQACLATRDNGQRNNLAVSVADSLESIRGPFDVIVANILSGTLVNFAPTLCSLSRPGTQLILSGILESQVEVVREAYADQYPVVDVQVRDGWACLSGVA